MLQLNQSLFKITNSKLTYWTVVIYVLAAFNKSAAKEVYYDFTISYFEGAPDGVSVQILGINNQYPGPTIRAAKNDILTVKVTNQIQDRQSTTIHWHGLEQYLTPFVDGPRMITQCDIPFNSSFTYRFPLLQSGTYCLHDGEFIIAPTLWFHTPGKEQYEWYKDVSKSHGYLPIPDSNLINGVGYYPCEYAVMKNMTCDTTNRDRYLMIEVERGRTYRLRYIMPGAHFGFRLSIDEHKFILIETDGVDTVMSNPLDRIGSSTGGRDSYLVTMNGDKDQYWIRLHQQICVPPDSANIRDLNPFPEFFCEHRVTAVLKYRNSTTIASSVTNKSLINPNAVQGRPDMHDRELLLEMKKSARGELLKKFQGEQLTPAVDDIMTPKFATAPFPTTEANSDPVGIQYNTSRPFGDAGTPDYVNQTILINVEYQDDPLYPNHSPGFNNLTYDTSTLDKPALFKSLLGETLPMSVIPIKINGFGSDYVVELILNDFGNSGNTGHPIHLHGHTFWIMGRGEVNSGPFIEQIHRRTLVPVTRRETTSLLANAWLVLRFRADNPGIWLLHCHIVHHLEVNMGLVFEEGLEEARAIYKIPQESIELCQRNGIDIPSPTTSNASTTFLVGNVIVAIILLPFIRLLL